MLRMAECSRQMPGDTEVWKGEGDWRGVCNTNPHQPLGLLCFTMCNEEMVYGVLRP